MLCSIQEEKIQTSFNWMIGDLPKICWFDAAKEILY